MSVFKPSIGSKLVFKIQDSETAVSLDYKDLDSLKLKLDGKVKIAEINDIEFYGGASVGGDIIKGGNEFEGFIEIDINKNIKTEINYSKDSDDSYIGAEININFF